MLQFFLCKTSSNEPNEQFLNISYNAYNETQFKPQLRHSKRRLRLKAFEEHANDIWMFFSIPTLTRCIKFLVYTIFFHSMSKNFQKFI